MLGYTSGLLAVAATFATVVRGQSGGWATNQVNTTLCQWKQLRAHVIRDTVYMDGGNLWWLPGQEDGTYGPAVADGNPLGLVYALNFSSPFTTTDNVTAVFKTISKVGDGNAAKNIAPNYVDGAMLGNDAEWFLYGGLLRQTNEFSDPDAQDVLAYQKFSYGVDKPGFREGFTFYDLPEDMTRYLAYGGAASAPSENKAWYFSGMHAPGWGPIYEPGINESLTAINVSRTLITLDMKTQQQETWSNETLPEDIPGRANPELVWVPVGAEGILVALGGVIFPDFTGYLGKSSNEAESKANSPGFMSTIDIYDVAGAKWYRQPTTGGPGQLTRGCAVVAPAQDYSSFNIYYYGGYSGLSATEAFNDDVWVLSIPSFTWTKVSSGTPVNARAGHKCFMPYPDQMFVIGGYTTSIGGAPTCLRETVRVFNLSSAQWLPRYDPAKWAKYSIPEAVISKIGGSPTGAATLTAPSPSFAASEMANIFRSKYPTEKIVTYYPYQSAAATDNTNPPAPPTTDEPSSGGGVPAFLPPVLGVVLGLVFLTMIAVLVLLWRRRRLFRARGMSEAGTEDTNGHRIMSWMRGHPNEGKTLTVTSDETPSSPDLESVAPSQPMSMAEMMNTEIRAPVELMDTSPRVELHDTGLSHVQVLDRYSRLGEAVTAHNSSLNAGSQYASSNQIDHASVTPSSTSVSHSVSGSRHLSSELAGDTPPSAVTTSPATVRGYIPSGVSNISERDRAHLRTISDTTVSSVASGPQQAEATIQEEEPVVSPPTGEAKEGKDYISAVPPPPPVQTAQPSPTGHGRVGSGPNISPTNPLRRSVFHESREDMTDDTELPKK